MITLPAIPSTLLLFSSLTFSLPLSLVTNIGRVPQRPQRQHGHEQDSDDGSSDEDPSHSLNLRLCVAAEHDADLVVDLLDLFLKRKGEKRSCQKYCD